MRAAVASHTHTQTQRKVSRSAERQTLAITKLCAAKRSLSHPFRIFVYAHSVRAFVQPARKDRLFFGQMPEIVLDFLRDLAHIYTHFH